MPVVVVGLKEAQKAMRALQPDLEKNLRKEIRAILKPILATAKGYVKDSPLPGLSNWTAPTSGLWAGKQFNAGQVRKGIKVQFGAVKRERTGFISLVRIVNTTPAGMIYEIGGRVHPGGREKNLKGKKSEFSHSNNPDAGMHFLNSIGGQLTGKNEKRGRLIYRAMYENQGKVIVAVMRAIEATSRQSVKYVDAARAFRKAA
jgi:hypothetical protein